MLKYHCKKLFSSISSNIVIVNGKRTPIGSFMGKLSSIHATSLGGYAIQGAISSSNINKEDVDELIMGNVISAGLGQAPARQAAIKGGLPNSVTCTTINKVCSSGMKAVHYAAQSIQTGNSKIVIAGGFESMSNVPHYLYTRRPTVWGEVALKDGIIRDGLFDSFNEILMGSCAEKTNRDYKLTRKEQDDWAMQSYERAIAANKAGHFLKELVEIKIDLGKGKHELMTEDEECQKYLKDKIPTLKPVFEKDGSITAANASKNADGACAMVLMTEEEAKARGLTPIAKIRGFADAELAPIDFSIAPSSAVHLLLKKTGLKIEDIDHFEFNEAFAGTILANQQILKIKSDKVNLHGGAVSLGHPIGMSGARIILSLINVLRTNNGKIGIAAICNGGGGASSICIERLH